MDILDDYIGPLLDEKASLDSPTFDGLPQAPTQSPGTSNTSIATTGYADTAVANHNDSTTAHADIRNKILTLETNLEDGIDAINAEITGLSSIYLPISGGELTGKLEQPIHPTTDFELTNKQYVDESIAYMTANGMHFALIVSATEPTVGLTEGIYWWQSDTQDLELPATITVKQYTGGTWSDTMTITTADTFRPGYTWANMNVASGTLSILADHTHIIDSSTSLNPIPGTITVVPITSLSTTENIMLRETFVTDGNGVLGVYVSTNDTNVNILTLTSTSSVDVDSKINSLRTELEAEITSANTDITNIANNLSSHKATDRFRWQDVYDEQKNTIILSAESRGLTPDNNSTVSVSSPYTVQWLSGGIIEVSMTNTGGSFTEVIKNDLLVYSSEGLPDGLSVRKYFMVNQGDVITAANATGITFTQFVEDPDGISHVIDAAVANAQSAIEASLTNYYTKSQTNSQINTSVTNGLASYSTTAQMNAAIASAVQGSLTTDQVQSIVDQAIQSAGANVVTQDQLAALQTAILQQVAASQVVQQVDSGVDPNGQYFLQATQYQDGRLEITGWVAKVADRFSAYFPGGLEFIDTNYCAVGCLADDNSNLDNNENNTLKFGSLRTNGFTCLASKFGVAILGGGAVGDDYKYSVGFFGRWR